jgi:hypothetical protein
VGAYEQGGWPPAQAGRQFVAVATAGTFELSSRPGCSVAGGAAVGGGGRHSLYSPNGTARWEARVHHNGSYGGDAGLVEHARRRKQRSEQHRGSASGLRCGGGRSHGNAKEEVHWPLSPPRTNDPTATKWSHGLTADWADRLNHLRAARKAELTKLLGRDETWGLRATGK